MDSYNTQKSEQNQILRISLIQSDKETDFGSTSREKETEFWEKQS